MARIILVFICSSVCIGTWVRLGQTAIEETVAISSVVSSQNENNHSAKDSLVKTTESLLAQKVGHPSFLSPHAKPIVAQGQYVFVANTPADTVDVISKSTKKVVERIRVGIDPVSLALRPDGKELWVSNHVSDSVSVIDLVATNPTYLQIIATIQDLDRRKKATQFDEPVAIAFANNSKAYVALSSENKIAVVNVETRKVTKRLNIRSQDPRDIVVRGDRLYVIPFESNNKTQLSGGNGNNIDGDLVTFDAWQHSIVVNNVLSIGHVVDIVKHPKVPDRDLYVFDTKTDKLVKTVDTLGTLLYGLTVDSQGNVFVAQTDARNDVNGRSGTKKHTLKELQNRAFLNQVTKVSTKGSTKDSDVSQAEFFNLEPLPPQQPNRKDALATPFAIQVSSDDSTLYVTAAGSNKFFTMDAESGKILGRTDVDVAPRGIALDESEERTNAWVLNAIENTVSLVDVTDVTKPEVTATIKLNDPTNETFKRGRIAFNDAMASSTGTFSCASCHPDGHTDQLLWVLKTPVVTGGNQIMPRSTMPIRGLRDTAPFHWDGIPGDPYGGNNSANIYTSVEPNAERDKPESTTRHLIDGGLSSTMLMEGDESKNDEGKSGYLTAQERDDMAKFMLHVTYPPAQRRAYDNVLTDRAKRGFELFHVIGDVGGTPGSNLCGNCHRMPFLVSTNTPGTGMDAPTWRGAYDRFLILPQGRLNIMEFPFYANVAEQGIPERNVWQFSWGGRRAFDPVWDMVLEGSTGYSGSLGRQWTLNQETAEDEDLMDLWNAVEVSAKEQAVRLHADIVLVAEDKGKSLELQFDGKHYVGEGESFTRQQMVRMAKSGKLVGTWTARHGSKDNINHPQPGLWTLAPIEKQSGRQVFPIVYDEKLTMKLNGRHIDEDSHIVVDGRKVGGKIEFGKSDRIDVTLNSLPDPGMHFLQIQNAEGLFSNDFIFHAAANKAKAGEIRNRMDPGTVRRRLHEAIQRGDLATTRKLIGEGAGLNARRAEGGMTPLAVAAFHGQLEIAKYLIAKGAKINRGNTDGNTPLLLAAFMCRDEMCKFLLSKGASVSQRNRRNETPIDAVSGEWNDGLARFYRGIIEGSDMDLQVKDMEIGRPRVKKLLEEFRDKKK